MKRTPHKSLSELDIENTLSYILSFINILVCFVSVHCMQFFFAKSHTHEHFFLGCAFGIIYNFFLNLICRRAAQPLPSAHPQSGSIYGKRFMSNGSKNVLARAVTIKSISHVYTHVRRRRRGTKHDYIIMNYTHSES